MKITDLKKRLKVKQEVVDEIDVNPLEMVANDEFKKPIKDHPTKRLPCYRERAIARVLKARVNFCNDQNCTLELAKKLFKAKCPYCGNLLDAGGGGGSADSIGITFECKKCNVKVGLSVATEGSISVRHKSEEHYY